MGINGAVCIVLALFMFVVGHERMGLALIPVVVLFIVLGFVLVWRAVAGWKNSKDTPGA